jgi:hypothetical protein
MICDGRRIEQRLNGVKCNEGFEADPSAGAILIQTELAEVYVISQLPDSFGRTHSSSVIDQAFKFSKKPCPFCTMKPTRCGVTPMAPGSWVVLKVCTSISSR